jgi:hypothetical protein
MSIAPGFGRSIDSEPEVSIETAPLTPLPTIQFEPLSSEYSIRKLYMAVAPLPGPSIDTEVLAFRVQSNFRVTLVLVPGTAENECHKQVLVLLIVPFLKTRFADDCVLPCPRLDWELTASPPSPGSGVWLPPGFTLTTLTLCAVANGGPLLWPYTLTAASMDAMSRKQIRLKEKIRNSERMTDTS